MNSSNQSNNNDGNSNIWRKRLRSFPNNTKINETVPEKKAKKSDHPKDVTDSNVIPDIKCDNNDVNGEILESIMKDFYKDYNCRNNEETGDDKKQPLTSDALKQLEKDTNESIGSSNDSDSDNATSETIESEERSIDSSEPNSEDADFIVTDDVENEDKEENDEDDQDENILAALIKAFFGDAKKKCDKIEVLDKLQEILMKRMIDKNDIINLNISDEEKASLIEKYISHVATLNIPDFIQERNKLQKEIQEYKKTDASEKKKYEDVKSRLNNLQNKNISLERKILELDVDDISKKVIYEKYKQMNAMGSKSDSRAKLKEWINNALKIPYNKICKLNSDGKTPSQFLQHVKEALDESLYGMKSAKEELLMILNNKLRNPESFKNTIALVGPPGTGKTALLIALCKSLNLPYYQISLGGKHDVSFFVGHSYTYEGSQPGQIVTALQQMECKNGILFFDEFDKIGERDGKKGVSDLLLHITDFTQNNKFSDEYISDIPIDLSKIWFVFSLNNIDKVDPILRNRMTFINVPSYSNEEKLTIIKNYIVPKCVKQFTFDSKDIEFTDDVINYMILKTQKEDGVREVERTVGEIFKRVNLLRTLHESNESNTSKLTVSFDIPDFKIPFKPTIEQISLLMNETKKDDAAPSFMYI